jgi:hypothetical protein
MTAERQSGIDSEKITLESLKDTWFPSETAPAYRYLTCASKTVEAALALGGFVGMIITKNPANFYLGMLSATGAATLSSNVAIDVHAVLSNRERNAKQK